MSAAAPPRAGGVAVLALAAGVALPGFGVPPAAAPCLSPAGRAEAAGRTIEFGCTGTPGGAGTLRGPARLLFGLRLDANRADAHAFEALPGIGPMRAEALVAARRERPFCRPHDLERVAGIGPSLRKALEPWLEFPEDACRGAAGGDAREATPTGKSGAIGAPAAVR